MDNLKKCVLDFVVKFVAIFCLAALLCLFASAQSRKLEKAVIKHAKNYSVSRIEKDLPQKPFAGWLQELVGKKIPIDWEVNDCGEQTGTSADRGRDFPMCVQASAKMSAKLFVSVNIQYGTFKRGILRMKPVVGYISVGEEMGGEYIENLVDLQKQLLQLPHDADLIFSFRTADDN